MMKTCEDFRPLLMGLMDGELSAEEAASTNDHLIRCAACREEYEQIARTCEKIGAVSFQEPGDAEMDRLWRSPFSRFARNAGWLLVLLGYLGLIGYGLYEFMRSGTEALFAKVALGAVMAGTGILLVLVIRNRIAGYRNDPYKEVRR